MIDTLRLRGPAKSFTQLYKLTKYQVWVNEKGETTYSPTVTIENAKDAKGVRLYTIFYTPSSDMMDVELNVQKLIFGNNAHNYALSENLVNILVRRVGDYFFNPGSYYITRIDMGFVQTLATEKEAKGLIDTFRNSRLPGSHSAKYKAQYYPDSIWYMAKNWVMKIYNKYAEIVKHDSKEIADELIPNKNMVRFEKQYRGKEIERVSSIYKIEKKKLETGETKEVKTLVSRAMVYESFKGIHIDSFQSKYLIDDLFGVIDNWERTTNSIEGEQLSGTAGLLNVLHKMGKLSDIEASGIVNRTTIYRYKQKVKKLVEPKYVVVPDDIAEQVKNRVFFVCSVGFAKIFVDRKNKK